LLAIWLIIIFSIALISKNQFPNQKELTRKIIHIGTGPIIAFAWWLGISQIIAILIASIITICLFINYKINLVSDIENIRRKSYGTIYYGLSITLLIIFFWQAHPIAIIAGVLVMAFGDGFAGLVGQKVKSQSWKILGQRKSIAGTMTMFIVSGIVLMAISIITSQGLQPINILLIMSLAVLLEQISYWGIDNLTVPIGVALSWLSIMKT
tara:strand:- start:2583 stop:3212 length:630 start_codon:yes stop_codon:yes gene_type:complete